jgi:hypothetical protein
MMIVFIGTSGDRSVGILPHSITIEGLPDPDDRETDRRELETFFAEFLGEPAGVRYQDECVECGKVGSHAKLCPDAEKPDKKIGDQIRALVLKRTGLTEKELSCPREKSDMTPCIARDSDCVVSEDLKCVGCGIDARAFLEEELRKAGKV